MDDEGCDLLCLDLPRAEAIRRAAREPCHPCWEGDPLCCRYCRNHRCRSATAGTIAAAGTTVIRETSAIRRTIGIVGASRVVTVIGIAVGSFVR